MSIFGVSPESFRAYKEGEGKLEASTAMARREEEQKIALYNPHRPTFVSHQFLDPFRDQMAHLFSSAFRTTFSDNTLMEKSFVPMMSIPSTFVRKMQMEIAALGITSVESLKKRQAEIECCTEAAIRANLRSPDYIALAIKADEAMVQAKGGKLSSAHRDTIHNYWQLVHTSPHGTKIHAEFERKLNEEVAQLIEVFIGSLRQEGAKDISQVELFQAQAKRVRTHLKNRYKEMVRLRPTLSREEGIKCDYHCLMAHLMFPSIVDQLIAEGVGPWLEREQQRVDRRSENWLRRDLENFLMANEEEIADLPSRRAFDEESARFCKEQGDKEGYDKILAQTKEWEDLLWRQKALFSSNLNNFEKYKRKILADEFAIIDQLQSLMPVQTPFDKAVCQYLRLNENLKEKTPADLDKVTFIDPETAQKLAKGTTVEAEMERMTQELQKKRTLFSGVPTMTVVK